jgi:hypothetical protein
MAKELCHAFCLRKSQVKILWPLAAALCSPVSLTMPSRREREKFDALTSRIYLILLGLTFLAFGWISRSISPEQSLAVFVGLAFVGMGLLLVFPGVLASDKSAISLAEKSSSHEIAIVFVLAALGLAWMLNRARKKT